MVVTKNMLPLANQLFEKYLKIHGLNFKSEGFSGRNQPDYLVYSPYGNVICEVKEFDKTKKRVYGPIRKKIDKAREQFKEYKDKNIPCVLILCNALNAFVSLNEDLILGAMYGNLSIFVWPIDQPIIKENIHLDFGKNGKLTDSNKTISAVAVLQEVQSKSNRLVIEADKKENPQFYTESRKTRIGRITALYNEHPILYEKLLRLRIYHNRNAVSPLDKKVFCGIEEEQFQ